MMPSLKDAEKHYKAVLDVAEQQGPDAVSETMAFLGRNDLYYLLRYILNRRDMAHPWLYQRCKEVQEHPNGYLDLWAREHYKSTIITFGLTIQDILVDPEVTIGIFSLTRPIAKSFLSQIRNELANNQTLLYLYPEILYLNPEKESPKWSLDDGIIVRRESNAKEGTIEAWGLVDGIPTGRHFKIRVYDDVINEKHVTNAEMIQKAIQAWELSLSLGSQRKCKRYKEVDIERYVGTRYHLADPYREIMERRAAIPRQYPATDDGTPYGNPVFLSKYALKKKRERMSTFIFACQMLQNPLADTHKGFAEEWIRHYDIRRFDGHNIYILVDPAGSKNKNSDYTVMWVISTGPDHNYYLLDGIRDRLNMDEKADKLFELHKKWRKFIGNGNLTIGYEHYGMQSDIEYIEKEMVARNYHFGIIPLTQKTSKKTTKEERIGLLTTVFKKGQMWLPRVLNYVTVRGEMRDLVRDFIREEYLLYPAGSHDDMLDCMARILDPGLNASFPDVYDHSNDSVYAVHGNVVTGVFV